PRHARVRLRAGVDVEGLFPVAVLGPLADDVAAADDEKLVGALDRRAQLPGLRELVPVDAADLADLRLLRRVGRAALGEQRPPSALLLRRREVVGELFLGRAEERD